MRELERDLPVDGAAEGPGDLARDLREIAIVGAGRAGGALARAATAAGLAVRIVSRSELEAGPPAGLGADVFLLCVPDAQIEAACTALAPGVGPETLVAHVSGASSLDALAAAADRGAATGSLHPLQTIPHPGSDLGGCGCAVAGSSPAATEALRALAVRLGMRPFAVPGASANRAAYHAAASLASNFLVALEESAAQLLAASGVDADPRELLAPLVLRTAANWSESGAAALTGPIARGDTATVARQRAAIGELAPELEALYDALAERTARVAAADPVPAGERIEALL